MSPPVLIAQRVWSSSGISKAVKPLYESRALPGFFMPDIERIPLRPEMFGNRLTKFKPDTREAVTGHKAGSTLPANLREFWFAEMTGKRMAHHRQYR